MSLIDLIFLDDTPWNNLYANERAKDWFVKENCEYLLKNIQQQQKHQEKNGECQLLEKIRNFCGIYFCD